MPVTKTTWKHADLIKVAVRWLGNNRRCGVVLWEATSNGGGETPDAIGWHGPYFSHLIEVKVSRADFLADAGKPFRREPASGVGSYRWYLVPDGIAKPDELPDGWGLLTVDAEHRFSRVKVVNEAQQFVEHNVRHELALLYNAMRRHRANIAAINGLFNSAWPLRGEMPGDEESDQRLMAEGQASG